MKSNPHDIADRRSLALARAAVRVIKADPCRCISEAKMRVERWKALNPCPGIVKWEGILNLPVEEIMAKLLSRSQEGQDIRQSNPFSVMVPVSSRQRILRRIRPASKVFCE